MNSIRWGIIGCGAVTEIKSGPAFYKVPGSALVAVTRRDGALARDYARRHHVAMVYDSAEALIEAAEVDAVYIATPPSSHKALALKVADAGKPCCVEKPMALNYAECQAMVKAFEEKNLPLFVSYYRRSLPRFLQIKTWLQNGEIGSVRQANWHLSKPASQLDLEGQPNWRTQPAVAGGGYFVDLASHGIDLLQYLLGDIVRVQGIAHNQQGLYEAEDAVSACWQFANGALGAGSWNFAAHLREDKAEIIGSEGKIEFSVFENEPVKLIKAESELALRIKHPEHIQYYHVENMIRHLREGIAHPSPGAEAAKASWVMDQMLGKRLEPQMDTTARDGGSAPLGLWRGQEQSPAR